MNAFLEKANSAPMYLIAGAVILFVVAMAIFFLIKAWREGVKLGMDKSVMKKAVTSSATFSFVPSIGILIGVIALAGSLGVALPWLRLSIIGALHYETMAADVAAKGAGMSALSAAQMTPESFVTIAAVMTIGIIWGPLFCTFFLKKYQTKVISRAATGEGGFGPILFNAMFIGLVCAFIGTGFADLRKGSLVSIIVIVVSALFMALFSWLINKKNQKWLESFALSFALVLGMAGAVVLNLIGIQ